MNRLKPGEILSLADGSEAIVESLEVEEAEEGEEFTTYNFEVEDFHTYFVLPQESEGNEASEAVWVHNTGCKFGEKLQEQFLERTRKIANDFVEPDLHIMTQITPAAKPLYFENTRWYKRVFIGHKPSAPDPGLAGVVEHLEAAGIKVHSTNIDIMGAGGKHVLTEVDIVTEHALIQLKTSSSKSKIVKQVEKTRKHVSREVVSFLWRKTERTGIVVRKVRRANPDLFVSNDIDELVRYLQSKGGK